MPDASRPDPGPVVKICGITRPQDAALSAELGARAIGLVFWPGSARAVSIERARAIARVLPPFVATVGLFVNETRQTILEIAAAVPLSVVQFHGDEPDDEVAAFPWRVIRAVSLEEPQSRARLARLPGDITILLDAAPGPQRGGTGRVTDWNAAAGVAAERRVLLAGGLRPDNIGAALRQVRPWGVDLSSGVEVAPGVKDPEKLRAFFAALRTAAADLAVVGGNETRA